jgi:hypothetical protein
MMITLAEWIIEGERYRAAVQSGRSRVDAEWFTLDPEAGVEGWMLIDGNLSSATEAMRVIERWHALVAEAIAQLSRPKCHPSAEPSATAPYLGIVR